MNRHAVKLGIVTAVAFVALGLCAFSCSQKAATTAHGVAASVQAAQQAEIALHNAGKVSDQEHATIQQAFLGIGQTGKSVDACIGAGGGGPCVDTGITAVQAMETSSIAAVKDPNAKAELTALCDSIVLALNNLKAAL